MVDVTQADRDRAVWLLPDVFDARVRKGKMDDHSIVQVFAMHRIEAYAAGQRDMQEQAAERMNGFGKDIFARLIRALPIKDQP